MTCPPEFLWNALPFPLKFYEMPSNVTTSLARFLGEPSDVKRDTLPFKRLENSGDKPCHVTRHTPCISVSSPVTSLDTPLCISVTSPVTSRDTPLCFLVTILWRHGSHRKGSIGFLSHALWRHYIPVSRGRLGRFRAHALFLSEIPRYFNYLECSRDKREINKGSS